MALWHDRLTNYNNRRNIPMDRRFDTRYPNVGKLQRGRIENIDHSSGSVVVEKKHVFHFLVNPSTISTSYNVDTATDLTDPSNYNPIIAQAPVLQEGLLSVSFQMLLDRTYEVWSGTIPEGVLHDVAQLEKVLGMPDYVETAYVGDTGIESPIGNALGGSPVSNQAANFFPGVIIKRPVRILFGGTGSFNFDGYVSSLSVEMMKFNEQMAPTRAGISISAESWGDPTAGGSLNPDTRYIAPGGEDAFAPMEGDVRVDESGFGPNPGSLEPHPNLGID